MYNKEKKKKRAEAKMKEGYRKWNEKGRRSDPLTEGWWKRSFGGSWEDLTEEELEVDAGDFRDQGADRGEEEFIDNEVYINSLEVCHDNNHDLGGSYS